MIGFFDWLGTLWCQMFHVKHYRQLSHDKNGGHALCMKCLKYREVP